MERWPQTIYIGAGVLIIVDIQMIYAEPFLQNLYNSYTQ